MEPEITEAVARTNAFIASVLELEDALAPILALRSPPWDDREFTAQIKWLQRNYTQKALRSYLHEALSILDTFEIESVEYELLLEMLDPMSIAIVSLD